MKKLMWLLSLLILIIGCGGEEETDDYLPLAVGNSWTYQTTYTMIAVDTVQNTGSSTTEITRQVLLNNNIEALEQVTTNIWDDTLIVPNSVDTTYLLVNEDFLLVYNDLTDTEPDTSLVLPIEDNNTWVVYADTTDTLAAEVIGQEDIAVPAGSFSDCWNIEYTSLGQMQNDWFALDVGIVRYHMQIVQPMGIIQFTKELESYSLE